MFCNYCNAIFNPKRDHKSSEAYLGLKTQAIQRLKSDPRTCDLPQLRDLELDLQVFSTAVDLQGDPLLPCPWYKGDLSWIPPEISKNDVAQINIWETPRQVGDIAMSATLGCELCTMLCAIIKEYERLGEIADLSLECWLEMDCISLAPTQIRFLVRGPIVHYWLVLHIDEDLPQMQLQTPQGNSSSDNSCLEFLLRSFETCTALHSSCRQQSRGGWIPTRLLDVGLFSSQVESVKLVERKELETALVDVQLDYLTLSHVWGNDEFLNLTSANLASFKMGIPIPSLRKSFQDAIAMARRLRVQYLWIDSLCILQDSLKDWQQEASIMDMVYSNGLCNLAACNGIDNNSGFFRPRNPATGGPISVSWNWSNLNIGSNVFYNWFFTTVEHTPLNSRGWVLQERLLSPRTMHFSTFPFWECRATVTCEAYPYQDYAKQSIRLLTETDKLVIPETLDTMRAGWFWNNTIYTYSRCNLTEDTDRLIALCGIAKKVAGWQGGDYLAGIWNQNLLKGMLWRNSKDIRGHDLDNVRPDQFIAPSWSWASVNGPIKPFEAKILRPCADILSAFTTSRNGDQFGQLVGGELRLKCALFRVPSLRNFIDDMENYEHKLEYDAWGFSLDECGDHFFDLETYFAPLAESILFSPEEDLVFGGLLIQKCSNPPAQDQKFQRVGFAVVSNDGNIANSGWYCEKWNAPPWTEEQAQVVTII